MHLEFIKCNSVVILNRKHMLTLMSQYPFLLLPVSFHSATSLIPLPPFSHFQLVSAGTYPAEGVQQAASSSDPLISSDLQAVETFGTWLGPLSLTSSSGGPSRNGNSLVSVQGVAAGRPPALSGRLLRPGKPRRGEGDSSRYSQPEELSCGRALAPTTRHIPAPSCESNWHSVA